MLGMLLFGGGTAFGQSSLESITLSYAPVGSAEGGGLRITIQLNTATLELSSVELRKGYESVIGVVTIAKKGTELSVVNSTLKNNHVIEAYFYAYTPADGKVRTLDEKGNPLGPANSDENAYVLKIAALFAQIERNAGDLVRITTLADQFM